MRKEIICAFTVTALVFTAFMGCGKKQDTETVDVVFSETESGDSELKAEIQTTVDTLWPAATQKPVVTEPTLPESTATKEPEATATSEPAATTGASATADTGNGKAETATAGTVTEAPEKTAAPVMTSVPDATPAVTPVPTPIPAPVVTAAPCNHNYEKEYWPSAPDCNGGGDWTMVCTVCGDTGATGTDPALPHTSATRVEADAKYCDEHGVMVTYCMMCGHTLESTGFDGSEHEWTTGTYEAWDEEIHTVVEKERTYCSRCGISR